MQVLRETGGIVGTVLDAYNKPIEGALAATDKQSALTDGRGHYALEKLPEGGHLLTAYKNGCTWQTSYAFVKTGSTTRVDFQLDRFRPAPSLRSVGSRDINIINTRYGKLWIEGGEMIFYYYLDVLVQDQNGNPVTDAEVSVVNEVDPTKGAINFTQVQSSLPGRQGICFPRNPSGRRRRIRPGTRLYRESRKRPWSLRKSTLAAEVRGISTS